jgi:hypothetical protein
MSKRILLAAVALVTLAATSLTIAGGAAADTSVPVRHPLYMPDARNMQNPALQPPPICCSPVGPPLAGQPAPVNMAYFGGHVQVTPKIYLVFWGWASPARSTTRRRLPRQRPGRRRGPDDGVRQGVRGAPPGPGARRSTNELVNGQEVHIQNPTDQFGGVWYDDTNRSTTT